MSKALITGGIGFVGYHLSRRLLADGWEVHALDNGTRGSSDAAVEELLTHPRYRLVLDDIRSEHCLSRLGADYTHIYHLAAIVGVRNVLQKPFAVLTENVSLLVNVLQVANSQKDLQRLVFASTSEVYAGTLQYFSMPIPTPESTPLTVSDLRQPRTSYMLSKLYGEALCHHAGAPFTIVRLHNVYGPRMGMVHVVPELLMRAHQTPSGGKVMIFSADHKRTFCYIDDAVQLIIRLAQSPAAVDEVFNVGSTDEETSIAALGEIILETVGKHQRLDFGASSEGSPQRRRPDMKRTLSATGYSPAISLRTGIRLTYDWYRAHVFDADCMS